MQPVHYEAIRMLNQCRFLPGSWTKRFVRDLGRLGEYDLLTPRQEEWLEKVLYRFRRQLAQIIERK